MKLDIDLLHDAEARYASVPAITRKKVIEKSDVSLITEELSDMNDKRTLLPDNIIPPEENLLKRKEMLSSLMQEPTEFAFERAIGKNDSVYSNFAELIVSSKQKVGRLVLRDGIRTLGHATGFLVGDQLLLTNWHVFREIADVGQSEVQFEYELDPLGTPRQPVRFELDASYFFHSDKALDYCLLGVKPMDISGKITLASYGFLSLNPTLGKLGEEGIEMLNIIHHPEGDYKQLSLRENKFTRITENTLWYESDTAQGSSGSPVLNDQWQVVALHHMGVPKKNEKGEYVDRDNRVIPVINNKIDSTRVVWEANEGIRISVILRDLQQRFSTSEIVRGLINTGNHSIQTDKQIESISTLSSLSNTKSIMDSKDLSFSIGAAFLKEAGDITIQISSGNTQNKIAETLIKPEVLQDDLTEAFRLSQKEKELDLAEARGYNPKFLGVDIPLPKPKKALMKFISKVNDSDSIHLNYFHFSTLHHSIRKMPVISAINVNGDDGVRLDKTARGKDDWMRDYRIPYEVQLNNTYYSGSGFDRGHMSRREDANWGKTAEEARRNADVTCMHTNACPQIKTLNQSKEGGLWGRLELVVLEQGIQKENGQFSKMSVFSGPIFQSSDPVFKDIQVPMDFYKIILWLDEAKKLCATAFRLSQINLIDWEYEALNIDSNVEFKTYQCSIASLEKATQLDFTAIKKYDTFKKSSAEEEMISVDESNLTELFSLSDKDLMVN